MNDYEQNIIKREKNNIYDVLNEMFDYFRLSKEKLITDFIRLSCFKFDIPFRKM